MNPLISVIIPIYGVEKYLNRAVDSVLSQTYRNLEIILVDDGSKDRCGEICDEYEKREARVRVIHKENGGLSDARNAGLKIAGGDYIAFLDSDDYYAPCFIQVLYEKMIETESEVSICTYQVTEALRSEDGPDFEKVRRDIEQGKALVTTYENEKLVLNQYDVLFEDATYFIVAWNKLYKASLWKDVRFPKGQIHEDEGTIYKILDKAKRGVYIKAPLYAYFSMPGSITRDTFSVKRLDYIKAMSDRLTYFKAKGNTKVCEAIIRARADGAIRYYGPLTTYVKECEKEKKWLKDCVREALKMDSDIVSFKTKLGYRLFLLFPGLYKKLCIR